MNIILHNPIEGSPDEFSEFSLNLLENSPHALIVQNLDSSIAYANPSMERLTGFSRTEIIGLKAPYPWWPENDIPVLLNKLQGSILQFTHREEECFQKKDGEKFWVETTAVPIKIKGEIKYLVSNIVDVTEHKRLRDETEFYAREVTRVQEEERKRIARELHDDTAQSLAYLALELDALIHGNGLTLDKIVGRLTGLKEQVDISLKEVRRFSHELRPGVLDQMGLISAIELLIDEFNSRNQVHVKFNISGEEKRLPDEPEQALFRIAQEALSNIRKHAQASQAEIDVKFSQSRVELTIIDDGKGFPPSEVDNAAANGRLGLIGMKERARLIGSSFSLKSEPGKGTIISVTLTHKP